MARINHLPPTVLTTGLHNPNGDASTPMTADRAKRQQDRRKGGQAVQGTGQAYRWTAEKARKAAQKRWHTRTWRPTGTTGTYKKRSTGKFIVRAKRRPPVTEAMRVTIRAEHAHPDLRRALWYDHSEGQWWIAIGGQYRVRSLSERAALVQLGYLKSYRGYVPDVIFGYQPGGTSIAPPRKP